MYTNLKNKTGNRNVAIGDEALENNASGDGNIALGYQAGLNELGNNKLYIGNDGAASSSIFLYGDMGDSVGVMGIGSSPSLHLKGRFEVSESISASGYLFSSCSLSKEDNYVVVWDSGSGRYYHTGSYGQVGGITSGNTFRGTGLRTGNSIISGSLMMLALQAPGNPGTSTPSNLMVLGGNITASYNISASKQIEGKSFSVPGGGKYELNGSGSNTYLHGGPNSADIFVAGGQKLAFAGMSAGGGVVRLQNLDSFYVGSDITASGDVSMSGYLHMKASTSTVELNTLMYDTQSGRVYYTGSYGGGGGVSSVNTFKGTGTRNGNSYITGSLTISTSGSTGGKLVIPDTDANGMGLIQMGTQTVFHNRGTKTIVVGENQDYNKPINYSTVVGNNIATKLTSDYNQLVGYEHMPEAETTLGNSIVGTQCLTRYIPEEESTGYNSILGYGIFDNITGQDVVDDTVGSIDDPYTLRSSYNIGIGYKTGRGSTGGYNIFIGYEAGRDKTGSYDIAIGEARRTGVSGDPHYRSLIEGEMRPVNFAQASGRARINNIINLTPTGSLPAVVDSKMGDIICLYAKDGAKHISEHYRTDDPLEGEEGVLKFFDGLAWKTIVLS